MGFALRISGTMLGLPHTSTGAMDTIRNVERPKLSPLALARVRAYVDAHLSDTITLENLAAAACISRFHFARSFRATTGSSPMEYVRNARIAAAKVILMQSRQPISVTAVNLGFFDQSHFTRTFRRLTGLAPGHFARQVAGANG